VDANEEDEPILVHGYLEILSTPGEYLEYWEDAFCCSADVQLTFDPYDLCSTPMLMKWRYHNSI
jgi:hypothetical protein